MLERLIFLLEEPERVVRDGNSQEQEVHRFINGDFEIGVIDEQCSQTEARCLTGRQVAWMIYTNLKASDTDESVLDINDTVNVELESDNVQSFNTRLERNHHRHGENQLKSWEICGIVSLNSWSCENRFCRCTFKRHVVQKNEIGDYVRLKKMDVLYLEQKFVISFLVS